MKGSFCESRKNSFINYQKETSCIFMLQLSAKHINIYSCQTSSSLNLSNSTALIHTGLLFYTALAHNLCRKKNLQSYKHPKQKSHYSNCYKSTNKSHPWFTHKITSWLSFAPHVVKLSSKSHFGSKPAWLLNADGDARDVRFLHARHDSAVPHRNWSLREIMTQLQEININLNYIT